MLSPWMPLTTSTQNQAEEFIVRYSFDPASYTVEVSDLSTLWEEKLDRRKIVQRALNDETSIDPSEDASQLRILLQKLEGALRRDADTTVSVLKFQEGDELQIQVSNRLPEPLQPLQWTFVLAKASPEALRQDVIFPMVKHSFSQSQQTKQLLSHLRAKDTIISKLIDKLETTGADLTSVFPNAAAARAGKKTTSREVVAMHVKDLGPFDEQKWRSDFHAASQQSPDWVQMVAVAFGTDGAATSSDARQSNSTSSPHKTSMAPKATAIHSKPSQTPILATSPKKSVAVPPAQKPLLQPKQDPERSTRPPDADDDASTTASELDDDEDAAFQRQPTPPATGSRANAPANAASTSPRESASATSPQPTSPQQPSSPPAPAQANTPPPQQRAAPRKIGRIGGAAAKHVSKEAAEPTGRATAVEVSATARPEPRSASPPRSDRAPATAAAEPGGREVEMGEREDEDAGTVEETAEEKTARRRAELKRELEMKRTAAAGRKKRKF